MTKQLVIQVIFTLSVVRLTEQLELVYLHQHGNNSAALKLFFTRNNTEKVLVEQVRLGQNRSILSSHQQSGWICWVGKLDAESHPEMDCYNQRMLLNKTFTLPTRMPANLIDPSVYIYLELDIYGNNIYWLDPTSGNVWATSLLSEASKIITFKQARHWSFMTLDTRNGYFFGTYKKQYKEIKKTSKFGSISYEPGGSYIVKLGETKLVSDRLGQLLYKAEKTILAVDSHNFNVYWILDSDVYVANYRDLELSRVTLLTPVAETDHCEACLQFFKDSLIIRQTNGSLFSFHLNSKTLQLLTNASIPADYALYEDRSRGEDNPCDALRCSHLCLPKFSKGYICSCPSGLSLVNGTQCKPSAIVSLTKRETLLYFPRSANLSDVYKECRILHDPTESYKNSSDCQTIGASTVSHVSSLSFNHLKGCLVLQMDPYGVSMLQLRCKNRCIEIFSLKTRSTSTLLCSRNVINTFVADYLNWIIFWVEESPKSGTFFVIGKHFPVGTQVCKFPLRNYYYGLAVNPPEEMIYWTIDEATRDGTHAIISADYDGGFQKILFSKLVNNPYVFYQFAENRLLLYTSPYSEERTIDAYDFDTNVTTTIISSQEIGHPLFLVPPAMGAHPCSTSNCSHTCIPQSPTQFTCGCPGFLLPATDHCKPFQITIIYVNASASHEKIERAAITERTLTRSPQSLVRISNASQGLIIAKRFNKSEICWTTAVDPTVQCHSYKLNTFNLTTIYSNSSMLVFGENGTELFYNDGYYGNITLKSLITNSVYNFQTFAPVVTYWTLDTQRKIFFWSGDAGGIHYQVLHEGNRSGRVVYFTGTNVIAAMTVDIHSRVLYFVHGQQIEGIAYKELFAGTESARGFQIFELERLKDPVADKTFISKVQHFQYYKKSLYWINGTELANSYLSKVDVRSKGFDTLPLKVQVTDFLISEYTDERHQVDPCADSPCSHFCFLENPLQEFSFSHKCACPADLTLVNGFNCEFVVDPIAPDNTAMVTWMSVISIVGLLVIAGLIFALWRRYQNDAELSNLIDEILNGNARGLKSARNEAERSQYLPLTCIVPPSELDVNESKVLGEGVFGMVLQGVYMKSTVVAVKTIKPSSDMNQLADFVKEIKIMNYIGEHNHIVRFFGAEISNIKKGSLYAILEFSPHGSLLSYLRNNSPLHNELLPQSRDYDNVHDVGEKEGVIQLQPVGNANDEDSSAKIGTKGSILEVPTLTWLAEQVALGMEYLTRKSVIHGDLATRNVLVFDSNIAKISDFGLSKQLYYYANYVKKTKVALPWRWMALESLTFMEFSSKSDVWAYGVTMWEIFAFGEVPYLHHVWNQQFKKLLRDGMTLPKPPTCPVYLYENIMKPCWNLDVDQRPNFTDVLLEFDRLKSNETFVSPVQQEYM